MVTIMANTQFMERITGCLAHTAQSEVFHMRKMFKDDPEPLGWTQCCISQAKLFLLHLFLEKG